MRTPIRPGTLVLLAALALSQASCSKSPTAPAAVESRVELGASLNATLGRPGSDIVLSTTLQIVGPGSVFVWEGCTGAQPYFQNEAGEWFYLVDPTTQPLCSVGRATRPPGPPLGGEIRFTGMMWDASGHHIAAPTGRYRVRAAFEYYVDPAMSQRRLATQVREFGWVNP